MEEKINIHVGNTLVSMFESDIPSFTTMPNAGNYVGKIVKYTGTTNANYTNGKYYTSSLINGVYYWVLGDLVYHSKTKQRPMIINDTQYSNHIRIGHTATGSYGNYVCSDLQETIIPTSLTRRLHDVDVDPFTDLLGFTHRNRVREDVEDLDLGFAILNDEDLKEFLNMISTEWFFVELTNKKTGQKTVHKMYASDREWNTYHTWCINGTWFEANLDFSVSFVEE